MDVNTLQGPYIATGSQGGHVSLQNMARNSLIRHYLPTRAHWEHMRQDGIRARCNLGFPQTGMKEDFVMARSLQRGLRHCMYVIRSVCVWGGVTLLRLQLRSMKEELTCSILIEPCRAQQPIVLPCCGSDLDAYKASWPDDMFDTLSVENRDSIRGRPLLRLAENVFTAVLNTVESRARKTHR